MNIANPNVPLHPFVSGQLLYLPPDCQSGVILQYRHYAGFAGAGAAVGGCLDVKSLSVYTIGNVRFEMPETYQQRQRAFQRRIAYAQALCKIAAVHSSLQRAYLIVRQLCLWLDPQDAKAIPHELLCQLVGVLPRSIDAGWQQYLQHCHSKESHHISSSHPIQVDHSHYQKAKPNIQVPVSVVNL
ncbi:hypothetical protein H6G89_00485 [Oscillatoria sp. FACHB-1407]|uniref:hypothetical protein n=1 Tax=Oscillatoria sp. FACHB-1407 TaxID=2692847 RepID=UPI001686EB3C|nr:hypothetical protein [Oscillatoria sp. FACHB-1407]MBD2459508.1 hypothetical protein [Oscillatoria sp. FACHB-1407]